MKIETPATIDKCFPGARAPDIKANLKVLANAERKYSKIVFHIVTNDAQLKPNLSHLNENHSCGHHLLFTFILWERAA